MQGWLLEEMSKFTKTGVTTPKYQIQNNFPSKKFDFKNQPQKHPLHSFPQTENYWNELPRIQSHTIGIF